MTDSRDGLCVFVVLSVLGCGHTDHGVSDDSEETSPARAASGADAGREAGARDAMADARRSSASTALDCTPGRYHGAFSCLISNLLPWAGDMDFSLVQSAEMQGEFQILEVVPGTRIMGHDDSFDGTFDATLDGTFDCQTGILTGSMEGSYLTPRLGFPLSMTGDLSGSYVRDAGVGGFDGEMGPLKTPDLDALGPLAPDAKCTWNAVRTGDALVDASTP